MVYKLVVKREKTLPWEAHDHIWVLLVHGPSDDVLLSHCAALDCLHTRNP